MDADRYLVEFPSDLYRPHVILPGQHFNLVEGPPGARTFLLTLSTATAHPAEH